MKIFFIVFCLIYTSISLAERSVPNKFTANTPIVHSEINDNFNHYDSGEVVRVTLHENCNRQDLSASATSNFILENISVNKKITDSMLYINMDLAGSGEHYGALQFKLQVNDEPMKNIGTTQYYSGTSSYGNPVSLSGFVSTNVTGAIDFKVIYDDNNSITTSGRPFTVYNPNSTDNSHLVQTCSVFKIMEIKN